MDFEACKSGKLLDGEMKEEIIEIINKFLMNHQKTKRKMLPKARKIIFGE